MTLDSRWNNPNIMLYDSGYIDRVAYHCLEADNQTFVAGQFIYLDAGAVTAATDSSPIHGIALTDATNTTENHIEIPFIRLSPGDIIRIQLRDGTTPIGNDVPVIGNLYGIAVASNVCYLDIGNASNALLRYLGPVKVGERIVGGDWGLASIVPNALNPPS